MRFPEVLAVLLCCIVICRSDVWAGEKSKMATGKQLIAWQDLRNPILDYPDWSIKDCCFTYRKGVFYLFFSAFYNDDGVMRSHVAEVSTRDFRTFSKPILDFSGKEEGYIGTCSPDIAQIGDTYYLTFNSWGYDKLRPDALFYMKSKDLTNWGPRRPLAANLTKGWQVIDVAVQRHRDRFYLIFQREDDKHPRIATARKMDGPWSFIGEDGRMRLLLPDGTESRHTHENFQFILIDGHWTLVSSDYMPHHPHLYTIHGTGDKPEDWLIWENGRRLGIPSEEWNTIDLDNAAALTDLREYDGYFYLLYAGLGKFRNNEFVGPGTNKPWARGWNRLGLARSSDLLRWETPGNH